MKPRFLIHIAFALLLTSCISEDIQSPVTPDTPSLEETFTEIPLPGYIAFNISTGNSFSSRAEGDTKPGLGDDFTFDDGLEAEYLLTPASDHHFIIFFDKTDSSLKGIMPVDITDWELYTGDKPNTKDNITSVARTLIYSSEMGEMKEIEEVMDFLNNCGTPFALINFDKSKVVKTESIDPAEYETNALFLSKLTKDQLLKLTLSDYYITTKDKNNKDTDYFTMSISRIATGDNWAYNFDTTKVFTTIGEALQSPAASIYVERVAAKVSVTDSEGRDPLVLNSTLPKIKDSYSKVKVYSGYLNDDDEMSYNYQEQDWTATVLGYGLNALEGSSYLLKQLNASSYFPKYSDDANFRSYWAEDENYNVASNLSKYPQQYRTALENSDIRMYENGLGSTFGSETPKFTISNPDRCLKYVSFNDINAKSGVSGVFYPLENTFDDSGNKLGDRGYFSASTHLLVACQLQIDNVKLDQDDNGDTHLYRDQNDIFYTSQSQLLDAKIEIMQNKMLPGGNSGISVLNADWKAHKYIDKYLIPVTWNPGDKLVVDNGNGGKREAIASDLTLIPAELAGGDGQVLIAPATTSTQFYFGNPDADQPVYTEIDYNIVVSLFHKLLGAIDHYRNGYMYYAGVIPHAKTTYSDLTWYNIGNISTVRNNWYNLKIEGVSEPGVPVDYVEQPIIPQLEVKRSYLNLSVEILDWHTITETDIPFFP